MSARQDHSETRAWALDRLQGGVTVARVAKHLARIPRWTGGTEPGPFSVAQHSCIVAHEVFHVTADPRAALYGLLHDGHEMVTSDIPSDVKKQFNALARRDITPIVEGAIDAVIFGDLALAWPMPDDIAVAVHLADRRAKATEIRDLDADCAPSLVEPLPQAIGKPWPWPKAEERFIETWDRFAPLAGLPRAGRGT